MSKKVIMIDLNELKKFFMDKNKEEETKKEKEEEKYWVVEKDFPHVIKKVSKGEASKECTFKTLDEAFEYRRGLSSYYKKNKLRSTPKKHRSSKVKIVKMNRSEKNEE